MPSNNVLVLGPPHSGKIRIAQHITKDLDTSTINSETHSGLIYGFRLSTEYFLLNVNLLIEEYPDSRKSQSSVVPLLQAFLDEFETPEFTELRDALDGVVFTMNTLATEEFSEILEIYIKIKELLEDNDIFLVVVGFFGPDQDLLLEAMEDEVITHGLEFVNFHELGMNEYLEKIGRDRLVEIFQTHAWSQTDKPVSNDNYASRKKERLGPMAKKLMETSGDDSNDMNVGQMDLDTIFNKLKQDKVKAQGMSEEEKKTFVDDLVDNYLEYF